MQWWNLQPGGVLPAQETLVEFAPTVTTVVLWVNVEFKAVAVEQFGVPLVAVDVDLERQVLGKANLEADPSVLPGP